MSKDIVRIARNLVNQVEDVRQGILEFWLDQNLAYLEKAEKKAIRTWATRYRNKETTAHEAVEAIRYSILRYSDNDECDGWVNSQDAAVHHEMNQWLKEQEKTLNSLSDRIPGLAETLKETRFLEDKIRQIVSDLQSFAFSQR